MNSPLLMFVRQFVTAAAAGLVPVVLVAFLSIPYALGGHPGEARKTDMAAEKHMT